jgi:Flp pilus assembly pilin Flp
MSTVLKIVKNAVSDRRGSTAMEYGLIAGILAAGLATAFTILSTKLDAGFNALSF